MKKEKLQQTMQIQRIIRDYYEQLYDNKMDYVEEMKRFLEKFNLTRLDQEETEIMNNPITSTKIEAVIKSLPKNKSPGPDGFTGEFYQTLREELMPILLKFLKKNLHRNEHFQTHSTRPLIAYSERCQICDLRRRFSFGTRDQI